MNDEEIRNKVIETQNNKFKIESSGKGFGTASLIFSFVNIPIFGIICALIGMIRAKKMSVRTYNFIGVLVSLASVNLVYGYSKGIIPKPESFVGFDMTYDTYLSIISLIIIGFIMYIAFFIKNRKKKKENND